MFSILKVALRRIIAVYGLGGEFVLCFVFTLYMY